MSEASEEFPLPLDLSAERKLLLQEMGSRLKGLSDRIPEAIMDLGTLTVVQCMAGRMRPFEYRGVVYGRDQLGLLVGLLPSQQPPRALLSFTAEGETRYDCRPSEAELHALPAVPNLANAVRAERLMRLKCRSIAFDPGLSTQALGLYVAGRDCVVDRLNYDGPKL